MLRLSAIQSLVRTLFSAAVWAAALIPSLPGGALAQCPGVWPNENDAGIMLPSNGLSAAPPSTASMTPNVSLGGDGGFYATYEVAEPSVGMQVYLTRVDEEGNVVWTATPDQTGTVDIACSPGTSPPVVCTDGAGGCFVAWGNSPICGSGQIWVARVASIGLVAFNVSAGNPFWFAGSFNSVRMVSDGNGGAWLSFSGGDPLCIGATSAIYINHVDFQGNLTWGPGALRAFCIGAPVEPVMDAFNDPVFGSTVVVAASLGSLTPGTITACAATTAGIRWTQQSVSFGGLPTANPSLACDPNGNIAIAWEAPTSGSGDIHMQQLNAAGQPLRNSAAQPVCDINTVQSRPRVVMDDLGGAYIVWQDARNSGLYMQHVDESYPGSAGGYLFTDDGIPLTEVTYSETECSIIRDSKSGFIATWRTNRGIGDDIYAQRVSPTGQLLWGTFTGVPVLTGPGVQSLPTLVSTITPNDQFYTTIGDPKSSYAFACVDTRPAGVGVRGVVAQRVDWFGAVGCAAPVARSLGDVPGDNGGFVSLTYERSYRDELTRNDVEYYSIWREMQSDESKSGAAHGAPIDLATTSREQLEAAAKSAGESGTGVVRVSPAGMPAGLWELVGTQPAHHAGVGYSYTAATRMDMSDITTEPEAEHHFFVSAHSPRPNIWWDSNVVTGVSVDNLAPPPPSSLVVQAQFLTPKTGTQPSMVLTWVGSTAPDLREYLVFRGSTPDFVPPSPSAALGHAAGERFQDTSVMVGETVYYRVAAIDRHGNVSATTAAVGGIVQTGTDTAQPSIASFLGQSQPNPSRGRTLISWGLAQAAPTSLQVFDVRGRLVRTLVSELREPGAHSVTWDGTDQHGDPVAAGTYVYRLQAGSFQQTRRLLIVK